MKRFKKLKPAFWDHRDITSTQTNSGFSFSRKWKLIVAFTSFMALLPLFIITLVEFSLTRQIIEDEVKSNMMNVLNTAIASFSPSNASDHSLSSFIDQISTGEENDLFLINRNGIVLTSSFYFGPPGSNSSLNTRLFSGASSIKTTFTNTGLPVLVGFSKIPNSSNFFILAKSEKWITSLYFSPRLKLLGYLAVSIILILLSIMGTATYLVGRIHAADKKRLEVLRQTEYTSKLASIGRLSSGVAHEINNPLAIINQKTGLLLDLIDLNKNHSFDPRLASLATDVLEAVKRCGTITQQLLDFSRDMETDIQQVNIREVIELTLAFIEKEAQRRHINISLNETKKVPNFECNRGNLQQIFLNLFENAFAGMEDGGTLKIDLIYKKTEKVKIVIADNGAGIDEEDINKIFEPFYSSKNEHWGTGLGLSITYGLVKEVGGDISVKSQPDTGTSFTLVLPFIPKTNKAKAEIIN